ncbi:MAG: NAD(P)H-dependent oxidoreductase [Bacteroidota bacterium]
MQRPEIRIVGLGGALTSKVSSSRRALELALQGAREAGASVQVFDLAEVDLPLFREGKKEIPASAIELCEAVKQAHGMIWCSPLYHGAVSGAFKNAIDWLQLLHDEQEPYLSKKIVGLTAVAGGVQALQAINSMEHMVRALRGWTCPFVVPVNRSYEVFDKSGNLIDEHIGKQLGFLGGEVCRNALNWQKDARLVSS